MAGTARTHESDIGVELARKRLHVISMVTIRFAVSTRENATFNLLVQRELWPGSRPYFDHLEWL